MGPEFEISCRVERQEGLEGTAGLTAAFLLISQATKPGPRLACPSSSLDDKPAAAGGGAAIAGNLISSVDNGAFDSPADLNGTCRHYSLFSAWEQRASLEFRITPSILPVAPVPVPC